MKRIVIPAVLQNYTSGRNILFSKEDSFEKILHDLSEQFPSLGEVLQTSLNSPSPFIYFFIDGKAVRPHQDEWSKKIEGECVLQLVSASAGG